MDSTFSEDEQQAPPKATLEDAMAETEPDDQHTSRSFSRTPTARSPETNGSDSQQSGAGAHSDDERSRRKRSVVVPTPRFAPSSRLRALASPAKSRADALGHLSSPGQSSRPDHGDHTYRPMAWRLGLEPKKLAVMQASLFSKPWQEHNNTLAIQVPAARPMAQLNSFPERSPDDSPVRVSSL